MLEDTTLDLSRMMSTTTWKPFQPFKMEFSVQTTRWRTPKVSHLRYGIINVKWHRQEAMQEVPLEQLFNPLILRKPDSFQ